jgi:tetratricopeptide (TPR) repeat protein
MRRRALLLAALAAPVPARAQQRGPQAVTQALDTLFAMLKAAPDEEAAKQVEARIWQAWLMQGSPAVQLLMRRGIRNLEARALADALEDFDAVIALAPELAEGWNKRATVYFLMEQDENSAKDILETLAREPRHFGALAGLSMVRERQGDLMGALRAFEAALAIHPRMPGGQERLRLLRRQAIGEDL